MTQQVYSIKDIKAVLFSQPYLSQNDYTAQRSFAQSIKQNESINANPEDFQLVHIGEFDSLTGQITAKPIKALATASDLLVDNDG
jgi:hypothetical protein